MQQPTLQRKLVWPGMLRLAHWGMAIATIVLLATAWLLHWAPSIAQAASDYHQIAGALLMLALLLRVWLLLTDRAVAGWRALLPGKRSIVAMVKTLQFYLSLGNMPLPAWYAHNPLWVPLYAVVLLLLVVVALTGFFMPDHPLLFGLYLPALHRSVAALIAVFTVAHVIAVVMHDVRARQADISGMLNGYRLFEIKPLDETPGGEHRVSLEKIKVRRWRPDDGAPQ